MRFLARLLCVMLCWGSASGLMTVAEENSATASNRPIVIAHRGASGYLPEHTLEAVALAYGMRADYIEQDVVLTKDSRPVVLHDVHIDTVTDVAERFPDRKRADGRFYAIDFSLAELKTLNVHERTDAKGRPVFPKRFPQAKSQFRIPTLEEEIELIQGLNHSRGSNVGIYPEIKSPAWHREQGQDISRIVLRTLTQYGYKQKSDKCFLQCFDPIELKRIRTDLQSNLNLVQLMSTKQAELATEEGIQNVARYADGIGPAIEQIYLGQNGRAQFTKLVQFAKQNQLRVHPYTVRADALPTDVGSVELLLSLLFVGVEVDGVFTDFPDLCVDYIHGQVGSESSK